MLDLLEGGRNTRILFLEEGTVETNKESKSGTNQELKEREF